MLLGLGSARDIPLWLHILILKNQCLLGTHQVAPLFIPHNKTQVTHFVQVIQLVTSKGRLNSLVSDSRACLSSLWAPGWGELLGPMLSDGQNNTRPTPIHSFRAESKGCASPVSPTVLVIFPGIGEPNQCTIGITWRARALGPWPLPQTSAGLNLHFK